MNPREKGFLLLTGLLGNPYRKPLTVAQFRKLSARVRDMVPPTANRELRVSDLTALGYSGPDAERILQLLGEEALLEYYLQKARRVGCVPVTRVSQGYPISVRKKLGDDSPGSLWAKGNTALLEKPCIALVGSRDLREDNRRFAAEVGRQAARQGYVLVSGNARGADSAAQKACLEAGGCVISVVADRLDTHAAHERILYLAEDGYDIPFSAQRALSRNRVIHSLPQKTLIAQATANKGGTWNGTVRNLSCGWSCVLCFDDGSEACRQLMQRGAAGISLCQLEDLSQLHGECTSLFADDY